MWLEWREQKNFPRELSQGSNVYGMCMSVDFVGQSKNLKVNESKQWWEWTLKNK